MGRLNIVRMIIPPGTSHPFGIYVIRHDVVVIGEFSVADAAFPVLLDDLPIQQLPHLCCGSKLPIAPGMVLIFNALHTQPYLALFLPESLPTAARKRSMHRTPFIATESHKHPLVWLGEIGCG
jgi:hypothetical protein